MKSNIQSFCMHHLCVGDNKTLTAVDGVDEENQLQGQQTFELSLPPTIVEIIPEGEDVSVAVAVFDEPTLFPVREEPTNQPPEGTEVMTTTIVGSQVISIQVAGLEDGAPLVDPIRLVLFLNQLEGMNETDVSNPVCVFWDFTLAGKWMITITHIHVYLPNVSLPSTSKLRWSG